MSRTPRWRPGRDRRAERHAPQTLLDPGVRVREHDPARNRVAVVGGGIAGIAAAAVLAEGGAQVTLLERGDRLGGRVASWTTEDGRSMGRGFHAFFRQYYNLRELLRRADPGLSHLVPLNDYPLVDAAGNTDSFSGIPLTPPWSVGAFALRSKSFPLAQVARVDLRRATDLLTVDFPASFGDYDGMSAAEVLDRLRFPPAARHLALEVFARSFFADPREFSGAELVAMFHSYFMGSAEGLIFDVPDGSYDRTLWAPLGEYLWRRGVDIRVDAEVTVIEDPEGESGPVIVHARGHAPLEVDAVVLATDVEPLRRLVGESAWLGDPGWRERIQLLRRAPRFAVWRLWLDTPMASDTPPFRGTAGTGMLDNVSALHLYEDEARAWVAEHGGSVVELHAYALPDDVSEEAVQADLLAQVHRLHPELAGATTVAQGWLVRDDCVLVTPEPWSERPGIVTPDPRVMLAGDGIRVDLPVALMERAATTGMLAASAILQSWGLTGQPVWSVPTTGVLARRRFRRG
ncbi:FAD-dependent oxidoreductase [Mobilicoccus caccae]|uniref:Dehydrogenase n=1 Tax=Mobilicoccus caccae TaxID=1859295 RepID=A0ABQ6IY43_9MICO|nr:FAD-dependent oxidoreductase [Mobilicoccus caccae]GMA42077.1 dehydrogenase [Mobilicoccus caccae]